MGEDPLGTSTVKWTRTTAARRSPRIRWATELLDEMYGDLPAAAAPPIEGGRRMRIVDGLNEVFQAALDNSDKFVFFGEDIEDPKGGVFGLTSGLSTAFPDRVFNSPLAEATIAGVACGLACYGKRPVFELQFIDFVGPGFNQISQNLATLRWRTMGTWKCPAVLVCPLWCLPAGRFAVAQSGQ